MSGRGQWELARELGLATPWEGMSVVGEPIETYCEDGLWRNSVGPHGPVTGEFSTREAALEAGQDEARVRGVQHVIRDVNGAPVERRRYPRRSEELPG